MTIAADRQLYREQGLDVVTREEWGARYPDYDRPKRYDVQPVADTLFLHIAVIDLGPDEKERVRYIERIGMGRFPSIGPSYNAAVFQSGRLYELQPLQRRGAHTVNDREPMPSTCSVHGGSLLYRGTGNLNYNARALVLAQNVEHEVTEEQLDSAARWGAMLIRGGRVKHGAIWHGHRDVTAKSCPGPKAYARIPELQALTERYVAGQPTPSPRPSPEADPMLIPDGRQALMRDGATLHDTSALALPFAVELKGGDDVVTVVGAATPPSARQPNDLLLVEYELRGDSRLGRKGERRQLWTRHAHVTAYRPVPAQPKDCSAEIEAAVAPIRRELGDRDVRLARKDALARQLLEV